MVNALAYTDIINKLPRRQHKIVYNLDAVPPIHVVSNHVDADKLTTANGTQARYSNNGV